ncbi:MAG TPA: WecB/TagA/CpsF family glycosyltransferase [Thermomicrobiales bacterium]|nr:WecB/TagA/CpsF family glycosyltransferase [Thermomicrobiales bacterium]
MHAPSINVPGERPSYISAVPPHASAPDDVSTDVLGVQISALTMPGAVARIERWIDERDPHYVAICTSHTVMECQRDPALMRAVNGAGMRTPDGMPLVWLSRRAGHPEVTRVYGPDLMLELCARSEETGHRHYFYGGAPGVAVDLVSRLTTKFTGLRVAGIHTPPMLPVGALESQETIDRINASGADIVWVGLGTPKQDWWVANHRPLLNAPVIIAVGAAFDFHSGRVRQAPKWMQRTGLEWLFRLSQDPRRLWRRYLITNVQFVTKVGLRSVKRRAVFTHGD